jgi:hypothetical protein
MDRKNAIVPKTLESEPNVAEPSVQEALDGMAQQLVVLTAEVAQVKTVLSAGVEYLNTCVDQEPSLSAAEYFREQAKTRLMIAMLFMVNLMLICLVLIRETLTQPQRPPSFWDTMLPHMVDFALSIEQPALWCH